MWFRKVWFSLHDRRKRQEPVQQDHRKLSRMASADAAVDSAINDLARALNSVGDRTIRIKK